MDTDDAILEWQNVPAAISANRTISVRFSWEGNVKDLELYINGTLAGQSTPLATGRRGIWATHIFTGVNVPAGNNTIRLVVNKTGGLKSQPMIDKVDIHTGGAETIIANPPVNVQASDNTFTDKVRVTWDPVGC